MTPGWPFCRSSHSSSGYLNLSNGIGITPVSCDRLRFRDFRRDSSARTDAAYLLRRSFDVARVVIVCSISRPKRGPASNLTLREASWPVLVAWRGKRCATSTTRQSPRTSSRKPSPRRCGDRGWRASLRSCNGRALAARRIWHAQCSLPRLPPRACHAARSADRIRQSHRARRRNHLLPISRQFPRLRGSHPPGSARVLSGMVSYQLPS